MTATLYELTDLSAGWRLPIHVRWINPVNAEVTLPDIPLLTIQISAMLPKLDAAATHRSGDNPTTWWISRRAIEQIAVPSEKTDPERVVVWPEPQPEIPISMDFVHAYCAHPCAVIKNPEVFAPIWTSVQFFLLHWLVNEDRSLELSFGRLDALPVRANWKNSVIGRVFQNRKYKKHYTAEQREFMRKLTAEETMLAFDADTLTMRWSCEFTPNREFHAAAQAREHRRKLNPRWSKNYLGQLIAALSDETMAARLYENLIAYCKETDFPHPIYLTGSNFRRPPKSFVPTRTTVAWYPVPLVTRAEFGDSPGSAVVPENASMLQMPVLQSQTQDVRDTGPAMDAAGQNDA